MIKEIFLPERLGKKRILAKRIAGIAIQEDTIYASLVYATKSTIFIERLHEEKIEKSKKDEDSTEQTIQALKKAINSIKRYDYIRIALPASMVIFKELEVPFIDTEKIRMVLDYEIEPMLPFSIDEAILDFIVTKTAKEQNSSQVLVAAIRTQDLHTVLDLYTKAGIEPEHITIDLFALYGLYEQIPEYQKLQQGIALIELGYQATRISFLQNGQLRLTRTIPRGIASMSDAIAKDATTTPEAVMQIFQTNGFRATGDDTYDKSAQRHIMNFFNDIQFTLNSFSLKLNYYEGVAKILFVGKNAVHIASLTKFSTDTLQIPCELFEPEKMFTNPHLKSTLKEIPASLSPYAIALGTAITSDNQNEFDLRRKEFELINYALMSKQLIAALSIVLFAICFIGFKGYLQISELQATITSIEKKQIDHLIKLFPTAERPKKPQLQSLLTKAEHFVKEKSELWAPFSQQRMKPLEMLLEVTSILDKKKFNIEIEDLSISETEPGKPLIEINGYFKSEQGMGSNFAEFQKLLKNFETSQLLMFAEPVSEQLAAERGIRFTIKLQKKES